MTQISKQEPKNWINIIKRQSFPVVTFEVLKKLHQIAEVEDEYPKHDYLVASRECDSEIMRQIVGRI
ncbi:hypothetical protein ACFYU8_18550 [Brevibacillus sp. NPDC003359]|uniref:hypothetical protein n=1 Tax=unclassified Brevibacillus TaxID=2684853 RepID=UPI0036811B64